MWRILNQEKTEIISDIKNIEVEATINGKYFIFARQVHGDNDVVVPLGIYSTKERARQVLIAALHMEHFEMPADKEV